MANCEDLITTDDLAAAKIYANKMTEFVESSNNTMTTPEGEDKLTITGMGDIAKETISIAVSSAGYTIVGDFSDSSKVTITSESQVYTSKLVSGSEDALWRTNQVLPYTPTGADPASGAESGKWVVVAQGELKSIARSLNVLNAQVIYSTDTTTVLDDVLYIHNSSEQITYAKPYNVGIGEVVVSIDDGVLNTDSGVYRLVYINVEAIEVSANEHGYVGDGIHDDTQSIQDSIIAAAGRDVIIPKNTTCRLTSTTELSQNISLVMVDVEVVLDGIDNIFSSNGGKKFKVSGGLLSATEYVTNRPQLLLATSQDPTLLPEHVEITGVRTMNVGLGDIGMDASSGKYFARVRDNQVYSDESTNTYVTNAGLSATAVKPWLSLSPLDGSDIDFDSVRYNSERVLDNVFDVHMQDGLNVDMCKFSGLSDNARIRDNDFINRNKLAEAEIDTFTGGYGMRFISNTLHNANVKATTQSESLAPLGAKVWMAHLKENNFTFDDGSVSRWAAIYAAGYFNLSGNSVRRYDENAETNFTAFTAAVTDANENPFNANRPSVGVVSNNILAVDYGTKEAGITFNSINVDKMQVSSFVSNVLIGGDPIVTESNKSNLLSLNQIISDKYNADDIETHVSKSNSVNDYIVGNPFINTAGYTISREVSMETPAEGALLRATLPTRPESILNEFEMYLLYVWVSGGTSSNQMVFLASSGLHSSQPTLVSPVSSRLNPELTSGSLARNCFKLGINGSGNIYLDANEGYLLGESPTVLNYKFEKLTSAVTTRG